MWILVEYQLRSFSPWLASILLDVAVGDDVVQDLAHNVYTLSKHHYSTKHTVILSFSKPGLLVEQDSCAQSSGLIGQIVNDHCPTDKA